MTSFGSRTAPWMPAPGVEGTLDSFLTPVALALQIWKKKKSTWQQHFHLLLVQLYHILSLFDNLSPSKLTSLWKPGPIKFDDTSRVWRCDLSSSQTATNYSLATQSFHSNSEISWYLQICPIPMDYCHSPREQMTTVDIRIFWSAFAHRGQKVVPNSKKTQAFAGQS